MFNVINCPFMRKNLPFELKLLKNNNLELIFILYPSNRDKANVT